MHTCGNAFSRNLWSRQALGLLGLALIAVPGAAAELEQSRRVDVVVLGDALSEKAHAVVDGGTVARERLAVQIGLLREDYPVATVTGAGSQVAMALAVGDGPAATPLLLEVQEIHNRRPRVFGYTVEVNGAPVYFRSYYEMAAGPNHYFVRIPRARADHGRLRVVFRNAGAEPFSLGKVWAYGDFQALAELEGTYQPMPTVENATVLLPDRLPKGADGKVNRWAKVEPAVEAKAWEDLKEGMQGTGYAPGLWTDIQYASLPFSTIRTTIDQALDRVAAYGVAQQVSFRSSEWGSHPNGMDGLGGFFSDITYSKVIYEAAVKDYRPTWHKTPGNTTWPTWNHPQLNRYLDYRLRQALGYYRDRRDFLSARGIVLPRPSIDQEWGLSIGDCNDAAIAQARKDGVALDARDGLNELEKRWTFDNMCQVANRFGTSFAQGIGRDTIVVDRGTVHLPTGQTRDENHVQTFADPGGPYFDHQWAGWQVAVGPHAWATGEFLPQLPAHYYDYLNARGSLTCPNMECMGLPTRDFIQTVYQRGFRMVTFLNANPGDATKLLPPAMGMDERPAEDPVHDDRKLLAVRYSKEIPPGSEPGSRPQDQDNVEIKDDPTALVYDRLMRKDPGKPGHITYQVRNELSGAELDRPLLLNLICQVPKIDEKDPEKTRDARIVISVGDTPEAMTEVETLTALNLQRMNHYHWRSRGSFDLGTGVRGKKAFFLRFDLYGKNPWDAAIERFEVVSAWPLLSGHLDGQPFTAKEARTQRLWLQDRARYQRALADFRELGGSATVIAEATALADQGRWLSAYRRIAGATSLLLPARFAIRGHGQLADHPLHLRLPDDEQVAVVELIRAGPSEFELELKTEASLTCTVEIGGLREGTAFILEKIGRMGVNAYRIATADGKRAGKKLVVADGKLVADLEVTAFDVRLHPLPSTLSGVFAGNTAGGILINTQHPDLWLDNPIFVPVDEQARMSRSESGKPRATGAPRDKDRVDLVINAAGKAVEVVATFGTDAGRIRSFTPPTAKGRVTNGIIELDNGRRYELGAWWGWTDLKVPPLKPMLRQNSEEALVAAFAPGRNVELTFCPYTSNDRLPRIITLSAKDLPTSK